jgi:hypothetical protein
MPTVTTSVQQIIVGILILLAATTILGATGWNFSQVSKIPENYMKKSDIQKYFDMNRQDHIAIERKLDHLLEIILEHRTFDPPTNSNYEEN